MSGTSDIPRYGLRKRPANDLVPRKNVKQNRASLPPPDPPLGVARPVAPKSDTRKLRASTLACEGTSTRSQQQPTPTSSSSPDAHSGLERPVAPKPRTRKLTTNPLNKVNTPTQSQERLATKPSANNTAAPHKLTINGQTFTGPLPPNKTTDPSRNAANIPGDHSNYKLFVCADCPLITLSQQKNEANDEHNHFHTLCYPTHPCLWSFPPKAREVFANRRHWLALNEPLEATRHSNETLPRLLDEDGEPVTRGLVEVSKGVGLNRAYDEVVMRKYTAIIKSEECCEMRGLAEGDGRLEEHRLRHRVAREEMLGDMGWEFGW